MIFDEKVIRPKITLARMILAFTNKNFGAKRKIIHLSIRAEVEVNVLMSIKLLILLSNCRIIKL